MRKEQLPSRLAHDDGFDLPLGHPWSFAVSNDEMHGKGADPSMNRTYHTAGQNEQKGDCQPLWEGQMKENNFVLELGVCMILFHFLQRFAFGLFLLSFCSVLLSFASEAESSGERLVHEFVFVLHKSIESEFWIQRINELAREIVRCWRVHNVRASGRYIIREPRLGWQLVACRMDRMAEQVLHPKAYLFEDSMRSMVTMSVLLFMTY